MAGWITEELWKGTSECQCSKKCVMLFWKPRAITKEYEQKEP
jgi:hypothetical protein